MNTLFARTLVWFIATVVLTFIALMVATALDVELGERRRAPFGTLLTLQLNEARYAYETGGREALRAALERFRRVTESDAVLTDAEGRDLLTGEVRTDLRDAVRHRRRVPFFGQRGTVVMRQSADDRYTFFLILHQSGVVRWFLQPEVHLAVLSVLTILSFAYARYLTKPVRQLQAAVECFGRGDFHARVRSNRRDELGQLARTFDQMADRIETLLEAERRLLLDVSHELRSPLARMSLAIELARPGGEDLLRHLDRIEKEAGKLNSLVGELLQVTRAEGDRSRMVMQPVPLDELLRVVVDESRIEANERPCELTISSAEAPEIEGDADLLHRALENIVRNAIRYTAPNSEVNLTVGSEKSEAVITIRDHGPGAPESSMPRLFDPFYRVAPDRDRASGGVGLGLAIARRAIQLHGGRVRAENANPGLRVIIHLPAATLRTT